MTERCRTYSRITYFAAGAMLSALALTGCTNSSSPQPSKSVETSASATPNASTATFVSPEPAYTPPSPSVDPTTEQFLQAIKHDPIKQYLFDIVARACQLRHEDLQQLEGAPNDEQIVSLAAVYNATYGLHYQENQVGEGGQWPDAFDPAASAQCPNDFPPHGG